MKQKIRIILKSFNHSRLNESCRKIVEELRNKKLILNTAGPISFPTKKRFYCVLRSPHVNKNSREQFEIRRYKKIIDVYSDSKEITNVLLDFNVSPGVVTELLSYR
uniref:Small ribosomal subunit protein uS10c n=1 Tax=Ishige okamurae TaxID=233772 RepID=A0A8E6D506_9PHAE|nr:ribosomal protein S10 [Ishige okamurae]QVJ99676.1 ribosomal protein S10 [Ishige okamurae]WAM63972.1 30S ribosomal protein S10 [Ishige okamurae]